VALGLHLGRRAARDGFVVLFDLARLLTDRDAAAWPARLIFFDRYRPRRRPRPYPEREIALSNLAVQMRSQPVRARSAKPAQFRPAGEVHLRLQRHQDAVEQTDHAGGRLRRACATPASTFDDYCDYLFKDDGLAPSRFLIDAVTTNKTDFFREPQHFDFLRQPGLPELPRAAARS
jgi:hypothetical protein